MRINRLVLLVVATIFVVVLSLSAVSAQDTDRVACDVDLILDLYVAEKFFGFSSFVGQLPSDPGLNLDNFDRGQFSPLFDDITPNTKSETLHMSDELHNHLLETMAMTDAEFDAHFSGDLMTEVGEMMGTDTSTLTFLPTRDVANEAAECATLRSALRRFFIGLVFGEVEFGDVGTGAASSAMTGTTGTTDATDTSGNGTTNSGTSAGVINVNLVGANEVPTPGDADASGTAVVYLRSASNEVCVDISVQHITLPATAAHIHQAAAGQSGPPVVTLTAPGENGLSSTCATVDAALMQELIINPQNFYVNVHNTDFPDGAARGQLVGGSTGAADTTATDSTSTDASTDTSAGAITVNLVGAEEVPGPGDEDASGTAVVYLRGSTNEVCVDITVQNITLPATAAHIHQAVDGQSGPPVVPLTAPGENGLSSTCATVDAALMQELIINPQNFYVNVHNVDFPDGAARGQLQ